MLYRVYCKLKNSRLALLEIEADTPAEAAAAAKQHGWEVAFIEPAAPGSAPAPGSVASEEQQSTAPSRESSRQARPVEAGASPRRALWRAAAPLILACCAALAFITIFPAARPSFSTSATNTSERKQHTISIRPPAASIFAPAAALPREPLCPCAEPTRWYISDIDDRFDISRSEVRRAAERAVEIWHAAWGSPLFVYDEAGQMPIRLEYDHALNLIRREHYLYEQRGRAYEMRVESFNADADRHSRNVEEWNRRGGQGSSTEFAALDREQQRLAILEAQLRREQQELERTRPRGRLLHERLGQYAEQAMYDSDTGARLRVDERTITIFAFNDFDHLVLILAHEFGHALRIDHVDDPSAVMHEAAPAPTSDRLRLSPADVNALRESCAASLSR